MKKKIYRQIATKTYCYTVDKNTSKTKEKREALRFELGQAELEKVDKNA